MSEVLRTSDIAQAQFFDSHSKNPSSPQSYKDRYMNPASDIFQLIRKRLPRTGYPGIIPPPSERRVTDKTAREGLVVRRGLDWPANLQIGDGSYKIGRIEKVDLSALYCTVLWESKGYFGTYVWGETCKHAIGAEGRYELSIVFGPKYGQLAAEGGASASPDAGAVENKTQRDVGGPPMSPLRKDEQEVVLSGKKESC